MVDSVFHSLQLIFTNGIGPVNYRMLKRKFGSEERVIDFLKGGSFKTNIQIPTRDLILQYMETATKNSVNIITENDEFYPQSLKQFEDTPPVFFIKGKRQDLLHRQLFAIVGSRLPKIYSIEIAKEIAQSMEENKIPVISGMAIGIDTIVHQESLLQGTVAVLGGGVDVIYPESNTYLYKNILENGCVVSTQPCGKENISFLFPARNKFLSALSSAIIVVEASEKSGSLLTARFAKEYGRPLCVVPGHPTDSSFFGNLQLLKEGCKMYFKGMNPLSLFNDIVQDSIIDEDNKSNIDIDLSLSISQETSQGILSLLGRIPTPISKIAMELKKSEKEILTTALYLSLESKVLFHKNGFISI